MESRPKCHFGEVEHMDELNEDMEKDLGGIAIEVVKGNKP